MDFGGAVSQSGGLETVRALHQTIVALRAALEQSKSEILELKSKAWPIDSVQNVIQALSIENHVLRKQIAEADLGYPKINFIAAEKTTEGLFHDLYGNTEVAKEEKYYKNLFEDTSNEVDVEDQFNGKLGEGTGSQITETNLGEHKKDFFKTEQEFLPNNHRSVEEAQEEQHSQNLLKYVSSEEDQIHEKASKPVDIQAGKTDIEEGGIEAISSLTGETLQKTEKVAQLSGEEIQDTFEATGGQQIDESIIGSPKSVKSPKAKKVTIISPKLSPKVSPRKLKLETKIFLKAKKKGDSNICRSLESLTVLKSPVNQKISFTKTLSFSNLASVNRDISFSSNINNTMTDHNEPDKSEKSTENQYDEQLLSPQNDMDQEVDDIELIFTTDETNDQDFKEELVPIDTRESNSNLLNLPLSDIDQISDRELDDDVFNDTVEEYNQDRPANYHQSSFEMKRDNSIFNSRSDNSINHEKSFKSYYSYQDSSFENKSLEKDESFDRFDERIRIVETDISKCGIHEVEYVAGRRNTCPNPIQYRPLSHREAISKGLSSRKTRPILTHSNASRRESGAQTDISALPGSAWRSESSLANKSKMGENFTTLPSKYPLPGSRLKLSEKTVEARRVLLSDIGFTSMVPELSRSADHLFPGALKPPTVTSYGQFLKATDLYSPGCTSQKFTWIATTATPSESSQTQSRYSSIYPLSPPAPSRRCSAPVSPSRRTMVKSAPSKVRFANGSLPELRTDWTTVDSGDSTDSLVEEAENYLRRSIDCIVTTKESKTFGESRRSVPRRASAPEPTRDNVPPQGWQPFLPRLPRDLKLDNWVKVITPEGRVRGGRVRYVGPVVTQGAEQFVGVQLTCPEGISDGTYGGRRYFQCEPYHGIFVSFKKVIMGWQP